jgi:1,4-alpha-glucan branching enzyme
MYSVRTVSSAVNQIENENKKMNTSLLNNKSPKPGSIHFAFPAPEAQQVSLAGDFNNWDSKATPMHKGAHGVWHVGVALKPGRHEYRFIADGVWQDDPAAEQRTTNALGTENCVKTVTT